MSKRKSLIIIALIYILAYIVGVISCFWISNTILKFFVFDSAATVVTFIFSVILKNSSVYDAYWSVTPMVMVVWLYIAERAFSLFQILFFIVFLAWSVRLTVNWMTVFTDFSYEDWRYRKYRDETPKILWPVVNFFGIHYMPTLLVFLGMLPIFAMVKCELGYMSVLGLLGMLSGISLEFFADRLMHKFLKSDTSHNVCNIGLWKYSRHPNYLGEITVWLGVFLTMIPYCTDKWYYCIGFIGIAILFNVVSIPLAEKRQLKRRPEYSSYREKTSRLLLLPNKK